MSNAFFLLFCLLIRIIYSEKCTINDYDKVFTPCNSKTNKRHVVIYKNNNQCDDSSPQSSLLILYSKSPSFQVNCDHKCPPGQIIDYNSLDNRLYCQKCPQNTYSLGGDFHFQFWNDHILSLFETNCHIVKNKIQHKNTNCTKVFISPDQKYIVSGKMMNNEPDQYILEVLYSFEAKYDGSIMLKYKKDTVNRDNHLNGEANFFLDYELILKDNKSTDWTLLKHSFRKGYHQFGIFYSYWKDYTDRDLVFTLEKFRIEGIDQTSYKCTQCSESFSPEGSAYCQKCDEKSHYSETEKKCIECPKGTISTNGKNCIRSTACGEFDYELSSLSNCSQNNSQIVTRKRILPELCIQDDSLSTPDFLSTEIPCFNSNELADYSPKCKGSNDYYLNNYKLLKDFYYPNQVFETIIDWKSNGHSMFISRNPQIKKKMILEKIINITSQSGYIKIGVNLAENESIVLSLNETTELITSNGVHTVNLKNGLYIFQLIYYKKEQSFNEKYFTPVELYLLHIVGSSQFNTIQFLCEPCPEQMKALQGLCFNNQSIENNTINNSLSECPVYTHKTTIDNNTTCVLDDIIESKKNDLKFNIKPYLSYLNDYCQYHPLCYHNYFIGPLNYSKGAIDLAFYFSFFKPNQFINNNTDNKASIHKTGHVFVVANFTEDNFFKDNQTSRFSFKQASSSESLSTIKPSIYIEKQAIVNIGDSITSVKLINFKTDSGIIVEYSKGGKCRNDLSQLYTSFVYYKCDKTVKGFSFPKISYYFSNHCGVIFEVSSPYFCKICSSTELSSSIGKCKESKKERIYHEISTCIFDYLEKDELYHYDYSIDSMDVLLSTKSKAYQLLFSESNHLIQNKSETQTIEGHYLSDKIEYESCTFFDVIESQYLYFIIPLSILSACIIALIVLFCIKYRTLQYQTILIHHSNDIIKSQSISETDNKNKPNEGNKTDNSQWIELNNY